MNRSILFQQVKDNIKAHLATTLGGLLTATCALVLLGVFVLVYVNLIDITNNFFHQSHYSVFLKPTQKTVDREAVNSRIREVPGVINIQLISPKQSKQDLLQSFEGTKAVLEKINLKNLPWVIDFSLEAGVELSVQNADALSRMAGVDELFYGRETKDQVETFFQIANFIGLFLVALLVIAILYIIQNTIMLGIRSRAKEIEVLNVLGATPSFIQLPFLIEGALIGIFSGLSSLGVMYLLYRFLLAGVTFSPATYGLVEMVHFFDLPQQLLTVAVMAVMGLISSGLATRKILLDLKP